MGGSRCSYRNCTMRSGVNNVHMFHFPVYDKKRCHQWLANAQKFEFLNLKLSQLRNRIICQHHFKDECFMNYLKDRLTFGAVPTEDGEYCDSSSENTEAQGAANIYSLLLNDNEVDDKYIKKNNSSVIYADFLTNGDVWEKQSLNETIWNNKVVTIKPNTQGVNSKKIDITPKENFDENSLITLPKVWREDCTKITEFENPILSDIKYPTNDNISDKTVNIPSRDKKINRINKPRSYKNSNYLFNNLPVNQQPISTVSNQDPKIIPINQDLHDLLLNNQNNNMIVNLNDLNADNNIVVEQITNLKWPDKQDGVITTSETNYQHFLQPTEMQYSEITTTNNENTIVLKTRNEVPIQFDLTDNFDLKQEVKDNFGFDVRHENQSRDDKTDKPKKPKIKILFEENLTQPIKITDTTLEPVSPSAVINVFHKKEKSSHLQVRKKKTNLKRNKSNENLHTTDCNAINNIDEHKKSKIQIVQNSEHNEKQMDVIPKISVFKHKISPERSAAIEKKRNFNKKLRDIIETCLEKLDEQEKTSENITVSESPKRKEPSERANTLKQNVGSYISKQTELPNVHEYTMKFIEARMQKMEDILLNKIEQNSQKIVELKKCIASKPHAIKSSTTQTSLNEESYKKQLYQEMSKFLSPNANSLVYEELFINKYVQKISNQPSPKRRKRR